MLNIGIIQMQATPLQVDENLSLAESLIAQVVTEGAQWVVLPEMFNVGYYFGEALITVAETLATGKTVQWLKVQAAQHNLYVITSLYERDQGHSTKPTMIKASLRSAARPGASGLPTPAALEAQEGLGLAVLN